MGFVWGYPKKVDDYYKRFEDNTNLVNKLKEEFGNNE